MTEQETETVIPMVDAEGVFAENLFDSETLPEDIRGDATLKGIPDFATMAKVLIDTKSMVGANTFKIPTDEEDVEGRDKAMKALGWTGEDYVPTLPADYPTEIAPPEELLKSYGVQCNTLRLLPAQREGMLAWWAEQNKTIADDAQRDFDLACETGILELKKRLGGAYAEQRELGMTAVRFFTKSDALRDRLLNDFEKDPDVAEFLIAVGTAISPDKMRGGEGPTGTSTSDIDSQIAELMADPAYLEEGNPKQAVLVAKVKQLFELKSAKA